MRNYPEKETTFLLGHGGLLSKEREMTVLGLRV